MSDNRQDNRVLTPMGAHQLSEEELEKIHRSLLPQHACQPGSYWLID